MLTNNVKILRQLNRASREQGSNGVNVARKSHFTQAYIVGRHISGYECKASAQERPYISRPSRTQQLANPKLVPELMSDVPNDLLRTKGVADEQLALKAGERGRNREDSQDGRDHEGIRGRPRKRMRSVSPAHSADSVSTISTNRSWSRSPQRKRAPSPSRSRSNERRRTRDRSVSRESHISSSSFEKNAGTAKGKERGSRRRMRSQSPVERGRRYDSGRRGSWRNRSRSQSMDRSSIAKHRRSLTPHSPNRHVDSGRARRERTPKESRNISRSPSRERGYEPPYNKGREIPQQPPPRKERSLSPFSKRLALTQAMNMMNK
ncbi:hypothetical protein GX51_02560 [Blastomyces parvus]|uniref:Uncharacterized protein n=1 Tax=Blastomyces parvus TaxID=2060905 RepID=A0A2B7XBR4_9EURO|nr:hypothetical protein GX51_02560 [Blastomyces parvus]